MKNAAYDQSKYTNKLTFIGRYQVYLADEAVDTAAHVRANREKGFQEAEIHNLILSLEVLAVVPLDHGVLKVANTIGVAVYL